MGALAILANFIILGDFISLCLTLLLWLLNLLMYNCFEVINVKKKSTDESHALIFMELQR